jgi:ribonuclease P protein component
LVREVYRQNRGAFPREMDLVVVAKKTAAVQSYEEVRAELIQAARKMRK